MIGRDRITVSVCRSGQPNVSTTYRGIVVTEHDGKLGPFGGVTQTRLILPRTFVPPSGVACTTSFAFANRTNARLDTPIVPIYDARGRVHHYECTVKIN